MNLVDEYPDVVYEKGKYWVLRCDYGFEVYKITITHSERCAQIGFKGEEGLTKAKEEIERRIRKEMLL